MIREMTAKEGYASMPYFLHFETAPVYFAQVPFF